VVPVIIASDEPVPESSLKNESSRASGKVIVVRRAGIAGVVTGIFIPFFGIAEAATITAKSVSFGDVRSAIGSACDGDTVAIPAGTASWTSTLTITKGITLQGAGNDKTVILDDVPSPGARGSRQPNQLRQDQAEESLQRQPKWSGGAQFFANAAPLPAQGGRLGN